MPTTDQGAPVPAKLKCSSRKTFGSKCGSTLAGLGGAGLGTAGLGTAANSVITSTLLLDEKFASKLHLIHLGEFARRSGRERPGSFEECI